MDTEVAVQFLSGYIVLQRGLLARLPWDRLGDFIESVSHEPRAGEVVLGGETWAYAQHGGGVSFKGRATGTVVDVPNWLDKPDIFDGWRIASHLGSLGRSGEKQMRRMLGQSHGSLDSRVDELIRLLVSEGTAQMVSGADGCYELVATEPSALIP